MITGGDVKLGIKGIRICKVQGVNVAIYQTDSKKVGNCQIHPLFRERERPITSGKEQLHGLCDAFVAFVLLWGDVRFCGYRRRRRRLPRRNASCVMTLLWILDGLWTGAGNTPEKPNIARSIPNRWGRVYIRVG